MQHELARLNCYSAARGMNLQSLPIDLAVYEPNWPRLLFAGSILALSSDPKASEVALTVAHAGLLYSDVSKVSDASAMVLTQLANHRAVALAKDRHLLVDGLEARLGASERILVTRRLVTHSLIVANGDPLIGNQFQQDLWEELGRTSWVSASAPTASGKTYLILRWLLNEIVTGRATLVVYLAPTRALVSEIERQLLDLAAAIQLRDIRIASLPLVDLADRTRPTILVLTQERLHVFLNALGAVPPIDIAVVDEVHKLGDDLRGVILQDGIERIARGDARTRFAFLSPLTENPETVLSDAPSGMSSGVVPSEIPTVSQNLFIARQKLRNPGRWELLLKHNDQLELVGEAALHARPDSDIKRLSYLALSLGRNQTGTLVYANGAAEAEKIAWQIYDALSLEVSVQDAVDEELSDLSDFASGAVHPQFQLVELVKRGVAFHYGNMPTLLRTEVERLFRVGKIRFLVCTSTLIEGVNLACRTILVRGPRKGNGNPMVPHDFWNLAGRAGRWGQDFYGNIVCLDVNRENLWPHGVPTRARYPIERETDTVLSARQQMLTYLDERAGLSTSALHPQREQVLAYLLTWKVRETNLAATPAASRLSAEYVAELDERLTTLLGQVDVPSSVIVRHPGVSAVALQSLLHYFRSMPGHVEGFLPAPPESDDAVARFAAIFGLIHRHLYPAFGADAFVFVAALVTVDWMRGRPLGQIIRGRIDYYRRRGRVIDLPRIIRDTMRDVEDVARFKAPKFLAAYLDVLKVYLEETNQLELYPADLRFDLYLEFGVATATLLSLIGLGLSRTSALAINSYLGNDTLTEADILVRLSSMQWATQDLPRVVKREIEHVLRQRAALATPHVV